MVTVYRGNNYLEAQLLAGLFEQHGIRVFLQGAALQGGLGELPMTGYLRILVNADDESAAQRLLTEYESGKLMLSDVDESWRHVEE